MEKLGICDLEFRHESAKMGYSTWQSALELEEAVKGAILMVQALEVCALILHRYTHMVLLNEQILVSPIIRFYPLKTQVSPCRTIFIVSNIRIYTYKY